MHQTFTFSSLPLAFLFFVASASAAPTGNAGPDQNQHAKAFRIATSSPRNQNGAVAVANTYHKYGWTVPPGLSKAVTAAQKDALSSGLQAAGAMGKAAVSSGSSTTSVSAVSQLSSNESEYLSPVKIGDQQVNLVLDTGSSDLWVYNPQMKNSSDNHAIYDHTQSSTASVQDELDFAIQYGDGTTFSGGVVADTVKIGNIAVKQQFVELPSTGSSATYSDTSDGIVGLGFQALNFIRELGQSSPRKTWFENAIPQLAQSVFTANLKYNTTGYFNFGGIDHTAYKDGTLNYLSIDSSNGYWAFNSTDYAIGSGNTQRNTAATTTIADTGSSMMIVNLAVFNAFWANVKGKNIDSSNYATYPCSSSLPDLTVYLGSVKATLPGSILSFGSAGKVNGVSMCAGAVQTNNNQGNQVYGDVFFQQYFAVFDYGNKRLGIAPHA